MASLFTLLVVASVLAGTSGCLLESIALDLETSLNTSQLIFDVVEPMSLKVDRIDTKVMNIDLRTREILTVQFIDLSKFDVSDVYQDRLYIASKTVASLNLQRDDAECVAQGGYLLEIDDDAERKFTLDFVTKIGGATHFATGGNDVDTEGTFVYYHSKKPVPSLTWVAGEPNNSGGIEDCMVFWMSRNGLNDVRCDYDLKYVCEIPLRP